MWIVQGLAHPSGLCEMPALWQEQKSQSPAPRDHNPARLLSASTGLSVESGFGGTTKWLPLCTNASGKPCILWPSWKGEIQKGRASWMKPTLGAVGRANGDERWRAKAKHHRINHSKRLVSRSRVKNYFNGIENFWSYAKHIVYHCRGSQSIISQCT